MWQIVERASKSTTETMNAFKQLIPRLSPLSIVPMREPELYARWGQKRRDLMSLQGELVCLRDIARQPFRVQHYELGRTHGGASPHAMTALSPMQAPFRVVQVDDSVGGCGSNTTQEALSNLPAGAKNSRLAPLSMMPPSASKGEPQRC